jgi:hypothetical protein
MGLVLLMRYLSVSSLLSVPANQPGPVATVAPAGCEYGSIRLAGVVFHWCIKKNLDVVREKPGKEPVSGVEGL